jgi:hypothetical protein
VSGDLELTVAERGGLVLVLLAEIQDRAAPCRCKVCAWLADLRTDANLALPPA